MIKAKDLQIYVGAVLKSHILHLYQANVTAVDTLSAGVVVICAVVIGTGKSNVLAAKCAAQTKRKNEPCTNNPYSRPTRLR